MSLLELIGVVLAPAAPALLGGVAGFAVKEDEVLKRKPDEDSDTVGGYAVMTLLTLWLVGIGIVAHGGYTSHWGWMSVAALIIVALIIGSVLFFIGGLLGERFYTLLRGTPQSSNAE